MHRLVISISAFWTGLVQMRSILLGILMAGAFNCFNVRLHKMEENLTIANMFECIAVADILLDEQDWICISRDHILSIQLFLSCAFKLHNRNQHTSTSGCGKGTVSITCSSSDNACLPVLPRDRTFQDIWNVSPPIAWRWQRLPTFCRNYALCARPLGEFIDAACVNNWAHLLQ